jgi:hypothetical protein
VYQCSYLFCFGCKPHWQGFYLFLLLTNPKISTKQKKRCR